ncbi:polyprenyl diphosphate synthase [Cardinium endosymbiont of Dermatophagoides farinae]|uniref:polyprenyl diphosphate synthase n=1 Tax=Cardinium endosymbiont of Dermatophagoides farinae TaxID=2597823 RepID=UPI001CB9948F|nr:polyprenyl diphosphate synthase [Cardinium endosymbiont of Dermatophagoides farinae]
MADKKKTSSFIAAIVSSKVFLICMLPFILLPGYTSSSNEINKLPSLQKKPKHIAIIMDGNGRWGKKEKGDRSYGHKNAKKAVNEAITGCLEQGISHLTLYAFSTENWNRPEQEIKTIFNVIAESIAENINLFTEHNIRFDVVGDKAGIPNFCWDKLEEVIALTRHNTALHLTVAINYGGKAESVTASETLAKKLVIKMVNDFLNQGFSKNSRFEDFIKFAHDYQVKITPAIYQACLNTRELPDIDLLIRTGGKKRISNFLPWQSAYSELYFTDLYWPDFKKEHLIDALIFFQKQQRNFGAIA